jgi:hypothetical protein
MPEADDTFIFFSWMAVKNKQWWKRSKIIKDRRDYQIILKSRTDVKLKKWAIHFKPINKIIANLFFNELKIHDDIIPQAEKIVVDKKFRGKGYSQILYKTALDYYGVIASDYYMFGRIKPVLYGVPNIWHKLAKQHFCAIWNRKTQVWEKYSKRQAFESQDCSEKSIVIFKSKRLYDFYIGENA